jgi:hypothetical protein
LLDAIGIFMVAFINTMISIYQGIKAKKILDKVHLLLKKKYRRGARRPAICNSS